MKTIDNKNGTYSLYDKAKDRFIIESTTYKKCEDLKKQIDRHNRDLKALKRGIR